MEKADREIIILEPRGKIAYVFYKLWEPYPKSEGTRYLDLRGISLGDLIFVNRNLPWYERVWKALRGE